MEYGVIQGATQADIMSRFLFQLYQTLLMTEIPWATDNMPLWFGLLSNADGKIRDGETEKVGSD